jgi:leukotriene-A4 hydrolase
MDFVVTPARFPFLGIENPQLILISPSALSPDPRDNYVLIHQMVHMWIGVTVSITNWNYFWLNEGVTTFV